MSIPTTKISGLHQIIDKYDFFIFDIWGVLHNGEAIYPNVKKTLLKLQELNKNFCFLSNAPRPNHIIHKKLLELGLDFIAPEQIVTSGDFYRHEFQQGIKSQLLGKIGNKIYALDSELNKDILSDLGANLVTSLEEADCVMIMSFSAIENLNEISYQDFFNKVLKLKLPVICPNPDVIVNNGDKLAYVNGYFANIYRDMGGKVIYFGKPHYEIYEYLFKKFSISKSSAIMIGDSLETDIKGANNFGIDSVLITDGIYKDKDENDIKKLFEFYSAFPSYILNQLDY